MSPWEKLLHLIRRWAGLLVATTVGYLVLQLLALFITPAVLIALNVMVWLFWWVTLSAVLLETIMLIWWPLVGFGVVIPYLLFQALKSLDHQKDPYVWVFLVLGFGISMVVWGTLAGVELLGGIILLLRKLRAKRHRRIN
jgi:hypothetical protein